MSAVEDPVERNNSAPEATPRVLVIGSQCPADSHDWHVLDTLKQLGYPSQFFQTRSGLQRLPGALGAGIRKITSTLLREPELLIERLLLRTLSEFQPSLVLVIQGNQLSPKTVARMRTVTRAPIACWCQDQMTALGRQFLLGAGYDFVFVKDRYMQGLFSRMIRSTTFHYLPEACNPRVHRSVELSEPDRQRYTCDIMIGGTLYYYRQEILRNLAQFDLRIWGSCPDWLLYQLPIPPPRHEIVMHDKARALRAARICLNTLHFAEVDGLNCRAFEIAGCGGFQLISRVPVLEEHFADGSELVSFESSEQLFAQVQFYLKNPDAAAQIAQRGQLRAHADHTYEHRLAEILRVCGGSHAS